MHRNALRFALFASTVSLGSLAHAGAGDVNTVVTPLGSNVTYSALATPKNPALNAFSGYFVNVSSDPLNTNTINNVVFTATIYPTDAQEKATFSSADGASCNVVANPAGAPANATTIACSLGQLRAGQAYPGFAVFFQAPIKDTASPLPDGTLSNCSGTDCLRISGITYYAEGTGGVPNSTPTNSARCWPSNATCNGTYPTIGATLDVTLGTNNPTLVKSAVQKTGGTLFTGTSFPASTDPFATLVTVPNNAKYGTAVIQEDPANDTDCVNAARFLTASGSPSCFQSNISLPYLDLTGTGSFLTIVLRMDSSNIARGTKISDVKILYTDDNPPLVNPPPNPRLVAPCGNTSPEIYPCLQSSVFYRNKGVQGWTPELDGDFEFVLISPKNGGYKVF